jgi:hypothetical protein
MNRVIVSFFALLAAAPLAAQEQTPRVLSLDEALEITLSGSPVIEASRYEEKAAQQERRAAIGFQGKVYNLGTFVNLEDAVAARKKAEEELYEPFLREHGVKAVQNGGI